MTVVYLNGDLIDRSEAAISIDDRGFLFGDAVYEALRARRGRMFEAERHLARLRHGLRELRLGEPGLTDGILDAAATLIELNGLSDAEALIYVQVSRGAAPRRHGFPPPGTRPTVFIQASPLVARTELCTGGAVAITHPDQRWERCDLKTTNLLANCLANQAAQDAGAYEAILVRGGLVTEGTHCNVFGAVGGVLRTHPLTNRILRGVTRDVVIELARDAGWVVRQDALRLDELRYAEEIFLTGTTTDVMPIVRLDGAPVGGGRPGPVAAALRDALDARMTSAPAGSLPTPSPPAGRK
ncbi:MAG TPA: aminotransferase class IV [Gemmatimonadaceae bacterium]|nr:aminotransferase class IV [Gemmatimonadaceae bacterium]